MLYLHNLVEEANPLLSYSEFDADTIGSPR